MMKTLLENVTTTLLMKHVSFHSIQIFIIFAFDKFKKTNKFNI